MYSVKGQKFGFPALLGRLYAIFVIAALFLVSSTLMASHNV